MMLSMSKWKSPSIMSAQNALANHATQGRVLEIFGLLPVDTWPLKYGVGTVSRD